MKRRIQDIAKERGKTVEQLLVDTFERTGSQVKVAEELGMTQGTISLWLNRLGYATKTILVKKTQNAP